METQLSDVCYFAGMGVPSHASGFDPLKSTLFVPQNSNYPAVDLLVWDAAWKHLYAIQVTITEKLKDHMVECKWLADKVDDSGTVVGPSLASAWKTYTGATEVELVWVSDNDNTGDHFQEWIVLLPGLVELFPIIDNFKRGT